ncbi:MAG: hypothetical protein U0570_00715 [Phycisphaerales bacterium]
MHRNTSGAVVCLSALAGLSHGAIVGTLAQVTQIAQPADAQLDVLTNTTSAYCWNEAQDVALSQAIWVNAHSIGSYTSDSDLVTTQIAAGTWVRSHYIHFDAPPGGSGAVQGFVKFDKPIIGVIVVNAPGFRHLDDSDFLGAPTLFTHGVDFRGMEMVNDQFIIGGGGTTIQFSITISQPGDFIRVITEGEAIPAPGGLALLALGAMTARRRR